MNRILFVYKDYSQFVRKDHEILSQLGKVIHLRSPFEKSPVSFLITGIRQFFSLLWYIWRSNAVYCWFADYHSFLPAMFCKIAGKKFYLVLGGYDVSHIEALNYGSFNKRFRGFCARVSMRNATLNLPVAAALEVQARQRAGDIRIKVLPTGYDPDLYLPSEQKEQMILTVSLTASKQRFMVKGLDRFLELAREMPHMQFVMIGLKAEAEYLVEGKPSNLLILPPLKHDEILEWYGKARYYAQFSRSEGLPNAICEAMLRNCIPVGVRSGGIPEAIGDAGMVFDTWDAAAVAQKIDSSLDSEQMAQKAREHVIRHFHYREREKALKELFR